MLIGKYTDVKYVCTQKNAHKAVNDTKFIKLRCIAGQDRFTEEDTTMFEVEKHKKSTVFRFPNQIGAMVLFNAKKRRGNSCNRYLLFPWSK